MIEDKIVLIKVREGTREQLKKEGIKGESYDTIIRHLLEGKEKYIEKLNYIKTWKKEHPEQVLIHSKNQSHKEGANYEKFREYQMTGLQHARNLIRWRHDKTYFSYKQIIAPESQIHHEWIPETADFKGAALVEKDQHMHGFIDVIKILEGEITLHGEVGDGEVG